jgi:hypothetical protein
VKKPVIELKMTAWSVVAAQQQAALRVSIQSFSILSWILANIISDFIEISDDESDGTASQINGSDLDSKFTVEVDSVHHEGRASNSGTTPLSNRLAVDSINDDENQDNCKVYNVPAQSFAEGHKSALSRCTSISHKASELQPGFQVTTSSTKHIARSGQPEDHPLDVFAEDDRGNGDEARCNKHRKETTVSCRNSTLTSKDPELEEAQRKHAQSPRLTPAMVVVQQLDLNVALPQAQRPRKGSTARRGPKSQASSIKSTVSGSTTSAKLESAHTGKPRLGKPVTDPNKLWPFRSILRRRVVGGKTEYEVDWRPTWEAESAELTEWYKQGKSAQKRRRLSAGNLTVQSEAGPNKRRR